MEGKMKIYSNPKKEYKGKIEDYPLENYPDYEPGKPPRIEKTMEIDYLDEVERIWGKKWGGNQGIGKLREAALVMPTEHELSPLWAKDRNFFWFRREKLELDRVQRAISNLGKLLEDNGVKVHWMETEETMGAYGPMRKLFMAAYPLILKGGAILPREASGSYMRGVEVNFLKFLTKINCPVIHMVIGKGLFGAGACVQIAEDVIMLFKSVSSNDDGLDQVIPVLRRCGVKEMPIAHLTTIYDDFESGGEFHLDMIIGILALRKAVIYPGYLDFQMFKWLKSKNFKLIEIQKDEHHRYSPANCLILEPGKVIMTSEAKETIRRVREAGVEVIEFDASGLRSGANGIRCVVMQLVRDPGPSLED